MTSYSHNLIGNVGLISFIASQHHLQLLIAYWLKCTNRLMLIDIICLVCSFRYYMEPVIVMRKLSLYAMSLLFREKFNGSILDITVMVLLSSQVFTATLSLSTSAHVNVRVINYVRIHPGLGVAAPISSGTSTVTSSLYQTTGLE